MELNIPIERISAKRFIEEIKIAQEWQLVTDPQTGELVLAVTKGLGVAAYKGPDPATTSDAGMYNFVSEVKDTIRTPSIARRGR